MPTFSPKTVSIHENNPEAVASFDVFVRRHSDQVLLATGSYPCTDVDTEIPIGSNGLFNSIADGTVVDLTFAEVAAEGHGENGPIQQPTESPLNPFAVTVLVDGAESIVVIV